MDGKRDWVEELRNIVTEAQALLNAVGADGDEAARQVGDKLTESLDRARGTLEGLEDDASRYVRDNPWQSLGLAAAIGLLAGVLISRRRLRHG
jgi:ElaB/YqjD/DUF883 family membrane-anchored ribosome-binding protein